MKHRRSVSSSIHEFRSLCWFLRLTYWHHDCQQTRPQLQERFLHNLWLFYINKTELVARRLIQSALSTYMSDSFIRQQTGQLKGKDGVNAERPAAVPFLLTTLSTLPTLPCHMTHFLYRTVLHASGIDVVLNTHTGVAEGSAVTSS